ncbi:MAG: nuclear transport factor 2 family protein [Gemmatimonadota bacterium]
MRTHTPLFVAAVLVPMLLVRPAPLFAQAAPSTGRAELLATDQAASDSVAGQGMAAGLSNLLTDDGILLYSGAPIVRGRGSVARLFSLQRMLDSVHYQWQPLYAEVSADNSFGVTWGVTAVLVGGRNETPPVRIGRYISAWERVGGSWKLAAQVQMGVTGGLPFVLPADLPLTLPALAAEGPFAAFISADNHFSDEAGRTSAAIAFGKYAAPDAVTFGGPALVRGPEGIQQNVASGTPADWKWRPVYAGGSAAGDLGFTVGESVIRAKTTAEAPSYGKYLTIWRRDKDGNVKFVTDGGNGRPAQH